jgi:hypothetical protein
MTINDVKPKTMFDDSRSVDKFLPTIREEQGSPPFLGNWWERHWMNTPGAFYCAAVDNCGTGPLCAPNNVAVDEEGYDVVFRQPASLYELRQVVGAADAEPFQGYGVDGDSRWTILLIREWWKERARLEKALSSRYDAQLKLEGHKNYHEFAMLGRWLDYYRNGMYDYLRQYGFFLEEGKVAAIDDSLPII